MNTNNILMKNGVALWLINHSKLSYDQIAVFCGMHPLEIEELGNNNRGVQECNPIAALLLTQEEIIRCENNSSLLLKELQSLEYSKKRKSKEVSLYNVIYWFLLNTNLNCKEIAKFLKCTSKIVESIKDKSFKNYEELVAINPVTSGICSSEALDCLLMK